MLKEQKTQLLDITMLKNLRSETRVSIRLHGLVSVKESKCQVALAKLINSPQHTRNLAICANRYD